MWSQILKMGLLDQLKGSQATSTINPVEEATKYFRNKAQFELYSGLQGMRQTKFEQRQHAKNREAEESYVRKHVWDWPNGDNSDDDMGDEFVNFGEIRIVAADNQPEPQPQPAPKQPQKPQGPPPGAQQPAMPNETSLMRKALTWMLATGAVLGGGGGGAAIGYLMRDPPPVISPNGGASFDFETRLPPWMQDE